MAEDKKPAVKPEEKAPAAPAAPEAALVVAITGDYYDPFKRIMFKQGVEVETELDGWLQSQIDVGLMKRLA